MTNLHTQARDEADLLTCPFCGDQMRISAGHTIAHVDQGDCPIGAHGWGNTPKARAAWNTRADLDALRKENVRLRQALGQIAEWEWHEVEPHAEDIPGAIEAWVVEIDGACLDMQAIARAALTPHDAVTPETKKDQ